MLRREIIQMCQLRRAKAARLLEDNPSMIKRPIVEHEGGLLVGFKEDEWSAHFS